MRRTLLGLALLALLAVPVSHADPATTRASYIAGTHTVLGHVANVPGLGTVPVTTATAVCQQDVRTPVVAVHVTTPSVGGACGVLLPASVVTVRVQDAVLGFLSFEYQPVDAEGHACGDNAVASSGDTLAFDARCAGLSVWPDARATYGSIIIQAA
jgi:hypothetical protein